MIFTLVEYCQNEPLFVCFHWQKDRIVIVIIYPILLNNLTARPLAYPQYLCPPQWT
jgi:hypothetical protein